MSIQVMSITLLELQNWMNIGVETALRALESKGKLTESANAILEKHAIILQEKGSLGSFLDKLFKNPEMKNVINIKYAEFINDAVST